MNKALLSIHDCEVYVSWIILWFHLRFHLRMIEYQPPTSTCRKEGQTRRPMWQRTKTCISILLHLPNEVKLYVLAFAAEVSMDSSDEMQFTLTSVLSYHVPHQSQLNTQSSRLPPRTLSLLENPLSFFTNTHHPSQRYHLSLSTKKDCIFSLNTVVNIDVAPRLLVCHIIT
jgi:hypothetical protein